MNKYLFWVGENWFKLTIVFILLLAISLTAYYFLVFKPKFDLAHLTFSQRNASTNNNASSSTPIVEKKAIETPPKTISSNITPSPLRENGLSQALLKKVMQRIVLIKCYGGEGVSQGSGTAGLIHLGKSIVVTNFHVMSGSGGVSSVCTINVPNPPEYSQGDLFPADVGMFDSHYPAVDAAILHIQNVNPAIASIFGEFPVPFCKEEIDVGDKVTLFGYPAFGKSETGIQSLTVTDGIVSGFIKTDFGVIYKTSAKMDRGISGGLAVHNENTCVLGIPTWGRYGGSLAEFGTGEILGQIQSWDSIQKSGEILR